MATRLEHLDIAVDHDGVRITAGDATLTPVCLTDRELDVYIRLLKEDIDTVARKAKRAIRRHVAGQIAL